VDTRTRILEVALDEFAAHGFHETSVREIAEKVGVTKAAVLYHFAGKGEILAELAEPMLRDLEAVVEKPVAPWAVLEGLLEVWLTHRRLISMNLHDLGMTTTDAVFQRFRNAMIRANVLVAGPEADLARSVRSAQAIAMLSDPIVLFLDEPVDVLRSLVLDGVRLVLDPPEAGAGGAAGSAESSPSALGRVPAKARRGRGRQPSMTGSMTTTARRLYGTGTPVDEIADLLGVSRATVYRHLD
jgi:AcrR family transcriptional regulator